MSKTFKAVMLVGARQIGKSTMLKHLAEKENRIYVSMDDYELREFARSDPKLFLRTYKPPVLIDEVQKAPELFEIIKIYCDNTEEKGLFWLTGSRSKKLLKNAGDSLAGRLCIMKMFSLSQSEKNAVESEAETEFSFSSLMQRKAVYPKQDVEEIYNHIWLGGMPELVNYEPEQIRAYWSSYIDSYLMRDAVDDNGITDTVGFKKFLRACAAFTGQLVNYTDLATASGVSSVTAKAWLKVLESMGIVFFLEPYYNNELKKMVKTPKLYFCDTGLCAYLTSWYTPETLMSGAVSGHFFENYVVGELLRSYSYSKEEIKMYFYRDTNQKEIDIVTDDGINLHAFEVKKNASPEKNVIKNFAVLQKTGKNIGNGGIICMAESPLPINETNNIIPAYLL